MVLDPQNARFPIPVTRNVGGFPVPERLPFWITLFC